MALTRVLVVGDADTAAVVRSALAATCDCESVPTGHAALAAAGHAEVVVTGEALDDMPGLELTEGVHARAPGLPVILLGGARDLATATEAGRRGVFDYVVEPFDAPTLRRSVERAVSARRESAPPPAGHARASRLVGRSPRFLATLEAIERVAQSAAPLLLVGETGTGKDVLAARIHALGPRRHRPFVVVNAAALPATLLDSELFGHAAGSFTGATRVRRGLVAEADGGTLFLDEIADLPVELQGRLLRVMETGRVRAVGADHERTVDVRFVAATHEPLAFAVARGRFREDLYYRLNVLAIDVPPLRERREDIVELTDLFLARALARTPHAVVTEFAPAAYERLVNAPWPGNVRELASVVERAVVFGRRARVEAADLEGLDAPPSYDASAPLAATTTAEDPGLATLREVSLRHVEAVLERTGGDKLRAADILGIDVSTLYRWKRRQSGGP